MRKTLMFLTLIVLLCEFSCSKEKISKEEQPELVVTKPLIKDTLITSDYVSQINSIQHIELRALEGGYLQKIYVDEGQFVKKGQLLFKIMPNLYQSEVNIAQAEANLAQIEYANTKQLADSNVVSKNELAMSKAKLNKANAELNLHQTHLNFTEIRAPFDGIINRFEVKQGSLVEEGELLSTLSDNSKMWVYFNVPEAQYLDFKSKKDENSPIVQLRMANNEIFNYPGKIETIEADFDNETGNIPFRATFSNPDFLLRHGETGNVIMSLPIKNALLIPQKATYEVLDKKYVFVVDKNGTVKSREIKISNELDDLFVVSDGLEKEDEILLEGIRKVRDNDKIKFKVQTPEYAVTHLKLYAE